MMALVRADLPSGTVTFLFTDIEGSTKLLHELGAEAYAEALAEHRRVIREACAAHHGVEGETQGDAFFFAFPTAPGALAAAGAMTEALASGPIQVRAGLHTGTALVTDEGYVGEDVHRAARIAAAGHGGQVLISSTTAQLVDGELKDLGEHRLKDLSAPERIYQLGDRTFPPLQSLYRTNLPVAASPFLGRETELAEVVALLAHSRLLTLTGPGGTGKTRLAAQAAGTSSDRYPDGVWWVPLETVRDPTLVLEGIAQVLEAKYVVAQHIADQRMLILLDSFDGVIEAARDMSELLARCPNLDLLVTSRERLNVTAEQEYPVPSFAREEAVGFFAARVRAIDPDFEPDDAVAELCRRLDDMPLALELAAAQAKVLSAQQILERGLGLSAPGPRDLPDRQRTLSATIEWSHELLTAEQRQLFRRLSVFAGGCTLEAAEEIAEAEVGTLRTLVDKSLVRKTDDRFRMLDTIRDYALVRLGESGEADAMFERLARYLIALATGLGGPLFRERQAEAFARLEPEHPNTRSVMGWALAEGRYELAAELTLLAHAWISRGHLGEARGWFDVILDARPAVPKPIWGRVLISAIDVVKTQGDDARMTELAEELVESMADDPSVDPLHVAAALADLSDVALRRGDLERAREYGERSLTFSASRGLPYARGRNALGEVALQESDFAEARRLMEEAAADYERVGHESNYVATLEGLAEVARREGDVERAIALLAEALPRAVALGDRAFVGDVLAELAVVVSERGESDVAGTLWGAASALLEGLRPWRIRSEPDAPAEVKAAGAALSLDEAVAYALRSIDA
jgi:predicted ATPase/class 3 adenylate cyclase